jgi:CubicO group peptidase (beta-lactamase class C family)
MTRLLFILILILRAGPALAEAGPVFSPTGPDADAYGVAAGYPLGTRATLNAQDHFVGAYSHYDELLPSRPVPRAVAPNPWRRAASELALHYTWRGQTFSLADYLDRNPATGLLIARGDTILFEHYRYGRTDRDRLTSQSMAKTVLGMLVGIAVAEGRIRSIDDAAETYVPALAGSEIGRTPIRALLHMACGIAFTETYDGHDDSARLNQALFRRSGPDAAASVAAFGDRVAPPDTLWHYAGLNSETLGLVLAAATGMHPADYLASRIWQRIGTEADASWIVDAHGQETTAFGVNAALRDWARFARLLAQDGAWDGQQIIPRQWVLDATSIVPGSFLATQVGRVYSYGYQTWILRGARREFALLGIHGQTIFVDPAAGLVLVHTAVRVRPSGDPGAGELLSLWRALVEQETR